jgi:hypothetical protein
VSFKIGNRPSDADTLSDSAGPDDDDDDDEYDDMEEDDVLLAGFENLSPQAYGVDSDAETDGEEDEYAVNDVPYSKKVRVVIINLLLCPYRMCREQFRPNYAYLLTATILTMHGHVVLCMDVGGWSWRPA